MSQALLRTINQKKDLRLFLVITIFPIAILLISYIFQVSLMIKGTSLIENYESKIEKISVQNKNLEIDFSQKNSLKITENLLTELNFEKVTKVDYIRVIESSVAAK